MKLISRILFFITVTLPVNAFAQSASWSEPATDFMETLETGLVDIGAPVAGIGILGVGIFMGATGRIVPRVMAGMIIGGGLIAFGPSTIRALIGGA